MESEAPSSRFRHRLHEVIFEADTLAGRRFNLVLLLLIAVSVAVVLLESVPSVRARYGRELWIVEWGLTILFTVEYLLRLVAVRRPSRYARSFFGIVDLLAVLPTYLSALLPGAQALLVVRSLRLLRVFRIFKLAEYLGEARILTQALRASARKIAVFIQTVLVLVLIVGSLMYLIETPEAGFTSIPQSIYWAIVTMTTVGYGDIAPQTVLGKLLASLVMILGYGIIAVPTGIVTVELSRSRPAGVSTQACPMCGAEGHDPDALFCKRCGSRL
ncbi:MAG TPA: ion transporter [Thermoanaerobaculia bacterium]|nr:ion transporter [Thermoanaerobaculia bacterium]